MFFADIFICVTYFELKINLFFRTRITVFPDNLRFTISENVRKIIYFVVTNK